MATELQSKTYFPGYYSMRDSDHDTGNGMWVYNEGKTLQNSLYHDALFTRPARDGYLGYDKEQVRQTFLKHDSIFRHQLQELHRLYKRQRELMNGFERRELHNHSMLAETSKSSPFLSRIPSEAGKNTQNASKFPLVDSTFGRPSTTVTNSIQSPLVFQRKMFGIELPADTYINKEENHMVLRDRNVNLSPASCLGSHRDGDALTSNLYLKRTHDLGDLNEPTLFEETSISATSNNVGNKTSLEDDIQRHNGGICLDNRPSGSERNEKKHLNYSFKAGQTRYNDHAAPGGFWSDNSLPLCKTSHVEPRKANKPSTSFLFDESKTESWRKRRIFGVEISEGIAQSGVTISESSCVSTWRKTLSTFGQNVESLQDSTYPSTYDPLGGNPNSLMKFPEFTKGKNNMNVNSNSGAIPSTVAKISSLNGLCFGSKLDEKQSRGCFTSNEFDLPNAKNPATKQFLQLDPTQNFEAVDCVDSGSAYDLNRQFVTPHVFKNGVASQQNSLSPDGLKKHENPSSGLPWLVTKQHCSGEQIKGKELFYQMSLDSVQNSSQQFFNNAEKIRSPSQILVQDSTTQRCSHESQCRKVAVGDCNNSREIIGFHVVDASKHDGDNANKNLAHDPKSGNQFELNHIAKENGPNNYISGLRYQIDLNLSLSEEDATSVPSLPSSIVKIASTEIDLEAPAVYESETETSPKSESLENEITVPSKLPLDNSSESFEELVKLAAEAIITISSSQPLEASCSDDCLLWFAELISCHEISEVLIEMDDAGDEESIPEGVDYFEFMTLKLKDTKEKDYDYNPLVFDEEMRATSLKKRPRKAQARKGRQKKDFQRDILPSLVSLSRHEVTKDLQRIEEIFIASGCSWQSSLSHKNTVKNGKGRKRLRDVGSSMTATKVCTPLIEQPINREVGAEERSLTGWGKRTRRLPRHRCPTANQTLALKC